MFPEGWRREVGRGREEDGGWRRERLEEGEVGGGRLEKGEVGGGRGLTSGISGRHGPEIFFFLESLKTNKNRIYEDPLDDRKV